MFDINKWGRMTFLAGGVIDALIAISWFAIASGVELPNFLAGYTGYGIDYQFAMFIGAMFMSGWTLILFWGAREPVARKGLLAITAIMLTLSVVIEVVFYWSMLVGAGFFFGATKRLVISAVMLWVYLRLK